MSRYLIFSRVEHCHRCKELARCIVRLNEIDPARTKKTALCSVCAPKVFA